MAQDIVIPDKPMPQDFPQVGELPRQTKRMFATSVSKMIDGSTYVLYGFIFGTRQREGYFFLSNQTIGLTCSGKTERAGDRSGKGTVTCTGGGAFDGTSPLDIPAKVYGRLNGTTTGPVLDARGSRVGTNITRWSVSDFPDPSELIAAFK